MLTVTNLISRQDSYGHIPPLLGGLMVLHVFAEHCAVTVKLNFNLLDRKCHHFIPFILIDINVKLCHYDHKKFWVRVAKNTTLSVHC